MNDIIKINGNVEFIIKNKNGDIKDIHYKNTILRTGKNAIANALANVVNDPFDFYIDLLKLSNGGTSGGVPRFVEDNRTGLFGTVLLTKNVISSIDSSTFGTAIFTSVIAFDDAVGETLNEMALELSNGDLFSMITFPDLNKTDEMQITINWRVSLL